MSSGPYITVLKSTQEARTPPTEIEIQRENCPPPSLSRSPPLKNTLSCLPCRSRTSVAHVHEDFGVTLDNLELRVRHSTVKLEEENSKEILRFGDSHMPIKDFQDLHFSSLGT